MLRSPVGIVALLFIYVHMYIPVAESNNSHYHEFSSVPINGSFSCSELKKWLTMEKHYSNNRKDSLFLLNADCEKLPVLSVENVEYSAKRYFTTNKKKCKIHDNIAVVFLSNFSLNHNFSHFLHGLLRLFCALLDAHLLVWNDATLTFTKSADYVIWLDENMQRTDTTDNWLSLMGQTRVLKGNGPVECFSADRVVYGSGCVRLLPPEKWYGYPGCRANSVLPAFSYFIKSQFDAGSSLAVVKADSKRRQGRLSSQQKVHSLNVAFSVRKVGDLTGRREIANIQEVYQATQRAMRTPTFMYNISFEDLDIKSMVRHMSSLHVFVSVHGAGMTNTFFMQKGAAVVEILPYPLCQCRSPDYFYGIAGYYQGSSLALGLKHYVYCVPSHHTTWHTKPKDISAISKCNWRHLHAVHDVTIDSAQFASLMRGVERDLVASGVVELTNPVINLNPNANG